MRVFHLKSLVFFVIVFLVALFAACSSSISQNSEIPSSIIISDNFINLYPDTIAYPTEMKSYKWNYEQGLMYEAFYQMWLFSGNKKYYDYLKKNIDYYIGDDGQIKTYKLSEFNIDNIAPGRALLRLFADTKKEKYKKAADTLREQLRLHPRTEEGGFWHKKIYPYQMWLDGLYMAEPFYAMYSEMFNETNSFQDIADQFIFIRNHLKNESNGLYYHGWDESKTQSWADSVTGQSPNFWGRAMGWYMMALVDVLDYYPSGNPKRFELLQIFVDLAGSLLKYRDSDKKLWYQVVEAGNLDGNYMEASASLMFIYSFAKGANKGYLSHNFYDTADESFKYAVKHFITKDSQGHIYLNDVCAGAGLGGNPYRDGSYDYYVNEKRRKNDFKGYGPLILAAIELEKGK